MAKNRKINNEWCGGFMTGFCAAVMFISFLLWLYSDVWILS